MDPARVWLPNELWMMIAYYLPRMPDQPLWQPWVQYRTVNRIFKEAIEDYYIEHYLQSCTLVMDYEGHADHDDSYLFDGVVDEPQNRRAILNSRSFLEFDRSNFGNQCDRARSLFSERGYHPFMIMHFANGRTDMLPMDLHFRSTVSERICFFDWRTYFCTLFDELRRIDAEREFGISNQIELAQKLDSRYPSYIDGSISAQAMAELAMAAGTSLVGLDGRLLFIRRDRRYRLGVRSGQIQEVLPGASRILQDRFERLDEDRVARKLLVEQWRCVQDGYSLEW